MKALTQDFDNVHDTGRTFRALLEALSNPGREVPHPTGEDPWMALAATLLDGEVTFHWDGDPETASRVAFLTGASPTSPAEADFLFLPHSGALETIMPLAKAGTFADPHLSATIITTAEGNQASQPLKGPGVKPGSTALLPENIGTWIDQRDALGFEYPLGIDLVFLTQEGIIAIPRRVGKGAA